MGLKNVKERIAAIARMAKVDPEAARSQIEELYQAVLEEIIMFANAKIANPLRIARLAKEALKVMEVKLPW